MNATIQQQRPRGPKTPMRIWGVGLLLLLCAVVLTMCQPVVSQEEPKAEPHSEPVVETKVDATDAGPVRDLIAESGPKDFGPPLQEVCAKDIEGDFAKLGKDGRLLAFGEGQAFQGDASLQYAFHKDNQFGVQNHFQGVLRWGKHLYISGGDLKLLQAHLFVVALTSRPRTGPWGANVTSPDGEPPKGDTVLQKITMVRENHWHAGGMGRYGATLVVPLENNLDSGGKRGSTIVFLDLANPEQPTEIPISIRSDEVAYAVGLTRPTKGGKYLLARWNDKQVVFFTSKSTKLADGFDLDKTAKWSPSQLKVSTTEVGEKGMHGQSVALLAQCDGKIYALMNDNTNRLPTTQGTHYLDLYRVTFPGDDTYQVPAIEKIGSRSFACPDLQCNFTAGGGAHIDQDGRLLFYSVPLFRDFAKKRLTTMEFVPQ